MKYQDSVFNQLLKVIPTHWFDRLITQHKGDYRVRKLGCRDQFLAMLYGQFTGRKSLRDLEVNFNANRHHFYHLGCRGEIKRSTLADANNSRPVALFQAVFDGLLAKALKGKLGKEAKNMVSLLDSTTVVLNKTRFGWATGRNGKSEVKVHTVYDLDAEVPTHFEITTGRYSDLTAAKKLTYEAGRYYVFDRGYYGFHYWSDLDKAGCWFVTRLKHNSPTQVKRTRKVPASETHIISDNDVMLNQRLSRSRRNPCNQHLREVTVQLENKVNPIRIITNDMHSEASVIAGLYKKRWQIELFFKWVKQNLKIKTFLGTSENAVKIQILIAMIAYLLLKLLNQQWSFKGLSLLVISRLIQTSLMRRIGLIELLVPVPPDPTKNEKPPQKGFCFA